MEINIPIVSIIIPTFNRVDLLEETIVSVREQEFREWECIIVDDGSTPENVQRINNLIAKDGRFRFYNRPGNLPKGGNYCRNFGIKLSKGKWIQFLDSDDLLPPQKISLQMKEVDVKTDVLFCPYAYLVEKDGDTRIRSLNIPAYTLKYHKGIQLLEDLGKFSSFLPNHSYLVNREILNLSGFWNTDLKSNQDGEFFCRVLLCAKEIKFVAKALVYYRIHFGERQSSLSDKEVFKNRILSWQLISTFLRSKGYRNTQYVYSAKRNLFRKALEIEYKIIIEHFFFFLPIIKMKIYKKSRSLIGLKCL
jgi:glycosyltransferase involved in cell wall biosynthesis